MAHISSISLLIPIKKIAFYRHTKKATDDMTIVLVVQVVSDIFICYSLIDHLASH